MTNSVIISQLKVHEGLRLKPYLCTSKRQTIGYGRNLTDKGITEEEALYLLKNDINECVEDLQQIFSNFFQLPEIVQRVLIDMRFMGHASFMSFTNMIEAIKKEDFLKASIEMQDSLWYTQVKSRGITLVSMMKKGA